MQTGSLSSAEHLVRRARAGHLTRWFTVFATITALTACLGMLPASVATALDQPEPQPSAFNWLDHVNGVRALAALPPLRENPAWSAGSMMHSRYMVKNDYLGHDEDEANPWFTPEGHAAAQNGVAYTNDGYDADAQRGIDALLTTPFHLVGVLDPQLVTTGSGWYRERKGSYQAAVTLDVGRGRTARAPTAAYPIVFPGNGQTMPFSRYYGIESPDPLPTCGYRGAVGAPLIVQLASIPENVAVTLTRAGRELDRCVFDETTYRHPDPGVEQDGRDILAARHAIVIMPREPLVDGAYQVTLSSRGEQLSWWFNGPGTSSEPVTAASTSRPAPVEATTHPPSGTTDRGDADSPVSDEPIGLSLPVKQPAPAAAPLATTCSSLPSITLGPTRRGTDFLQVTVAARGDQNSLRLLQFGSAGQPLQNALVLVPGYQQPIVTETALPLPDGVAQRSFVVQRAQSSRPMSAQIIVVDACGAWQAVVSGGRDDGLTLVPMPGSR